MSIHDSLERRGERLMTRHRKLLFGLRLDAAVGRAPVPSMVVDLRAVEAELRSIGLYATSWRRINAR